MIALPTMTALLVAYGIVLLVLCSYGVHRAHLVWCWWRSQAAVKQVAENHRLPSGSELPQVTVQLPLYNEATVVERLLEAVAAFDYPRHLLQIQVLDDSTDETRMLAARKASQLAEEGLNIQYVRRPNREGYKAGALDFGLKNATGELIAMFDADFVPQPNFLKAIVGHFEDPGVAMVQTRWTHMNRQHSLLTRLQALLLDGHHLVENQARFGTGCLFNFSGTGGIWRRSAIDDAGGWQHDTLTEDLDLSYRAQLRGWKFVYRPDVITPAELPEEVCAFRAQQFRWAKGTVQCARKLMSRVMDSKLSPRQRCEAFFHLTPHVTYPAMMMLTILILPAVILIPVGDLQTMLAIDLPLCTGATGSIGIFFATAERLQGRSAWSAIKKLPALIALGAGLSPLVSKAVFEGARQMSGEFVRTPKRGTAIGRYRQRAKLPWVEMLLGAVSTASIVASIHSGHYFATPFTLLFAAGYWYVAYHVIVEQLGTREEVPRLVTSN
jgi:cellulose synthase/poly-beta-1,6-N-acetylglucosamine synthase-like glycosyltransferase